MIQRKEFRVVLDIYIIRRTFTKPFQFRYPSSAMSGERLVQKFTFIEILTSNVIFIEYSSLKFNSNSFVNIQELVKSLFTNSVVVLFKLL